MPAQPRNEDTLAFTEHANDVPHTRPTPDRPTRSSAHDALIDIANVADRLGVTVRHVRRLVHERRIPFIKWGHLIRFDPVEVSEWIDAYRRRAERAG